MTGILLTAHSRRLVEGLAELLAQLAPGVPVVAVGGAGDALGVDAGQVVAGVQELSAAGVEGIVALFDLGSALFSLENAHDLLADDPACCPFLIADAPLVEGAVAAAVTALAGSPAAVREAAEAAWNTRKRAEG